MSPQGLFAFFLLLGGLIFIHEFGHFLFAKIFGIRVEVFSLGFGPRLLGFRRGYTDYRISAIPLGGYVKMLGENPEEALVGSGEEFQSRSKPVRFVVLVMGAGMNLLLAVGIYWVLFQTGIQELAFLRAPAVVGEVQPESPAAEAGFEPGDRILALGGKEVPTWLEFSNAVQLRPNTGTTVTVDRAGERLVLPVEIATPPLEDPREKYRMGYLGIGPHVPTVVLEVEEESPAARGGLRAGDLVVRLADVPLYGTDTRGRIVEAVQGSPGRSLEITVLRDGEERRLVLVPEEVEGKGRVGAAFSVELESIRYGPWGALVASVETNARSAGLVFAFLRRLVGGKLSLNSMSGPVDIYKFSGEALRSGWQSFFTLMAVISLQLGIINLLPIPVLDGGHIFVLLLEGILRRDLSMQVKERMMQVGFLFLVTLMGVVISIDLIKNLVG